MLAILYCDRAHSFHTSLLRHFLGLQTQDLIFSAAQPLGAWAPGHMRRKKMAQKDPSCSASFFRQELYKDPISGLPLPHSLRLSDFSICDELSAQPSKANSGLFRAGISQAPENGIHCISALPPTNSSPSSLAWGCFICFFTRQGKWLDICAAKWRESFWCKSIGRGRPNRFAHRVDLKDR